ncbi:hypothetical protein SH2C18_45380 [Clostridium sediminicola]|uniref:hypothetical protein n=1 Tax=Clostridium sediminicola TaxID=3114879 RepID=UPI0031F1F755
MENQSIEMKLRLERQFKNSMGWFFWIAGLSLINSICFLFDLGFNFVIGLGITQIVDLFSYEFSYYYGNTALIVGIIINIILIGIFIVFGKLANNGKKWAIILGMIVLGLDTLVFIYIQDFISIGFHIWVLYSIYKGIGALKKLESMESIEVTENTEMFVEEI